MELARQRQERPQRKSEAHGNASVGKREMIWSLAEVLLATGGKLHSGGTWAEFLQVSTDSRLVRPGDLFVALSGERFDGHAYLEEALCKGAAGLLLARPPEKALPVPVILVEDTLRALGDLAANRRGRLRNLRVLAVTGSCGKTTVKEMLAAILGMEHRILKTQGNFNNLVGLPLSLLPVGPEHEFAVLEMGMNVPGEIARLTEIADPDIACITNIQDAHLAGLSDINGVARAKGELFRGIKGWGVLVVNLDDQRVRRLAKRCRQKKVGFGRSPLAQVRGLRLKSLAEKGMAFTLQINGKAARVRISGLGAHNVQNALAAAALAHAAGIGLKKIIVGLESFRPFERRLQVQDLIGGVRLVNDAYNANPSSMLAALETLSRLGQGSKRLVILGDMLELGSQSLASHRKIGEAVARHGFDQLLAVGDLSKAMVDAARQAGMSTERARHFADKASVTAWLRQEIDSGRLRADDWVLLKGSRGMRMESIVSDILAQAN